MLSTPGGTFTNISTIILIIILQFLCSHVPTSEDRLVKTNITEASEAHLSTFHHDERLHITKKINSPPALTCGICGNHADPVTLATQTPWTLDPLDKNSWRQPWFWHVQLFYRASLLMHRYLCTSYDSQHLLITARQVLRLANCAAKHCLHFTLIHVL